MNVIHDDGAGGNSNDQVLGPAAVTLRASAMLAALGAPSLAMGQRGQAIDACLGNHDDAAPIAAVAAVGTAARNIFLAAEAHATVAAAAGFDFDGDAIDEHVKSGQRWEVRGQGNKNRDAWRHPWS